MSVTHIAGLIVTVNGRLIQRCAVCGEKLVDGSWHCPYNITLTSCEGHKIGVSSIPPGSIVSIDDGTVTIGDQYSRDDNCLPLVEL
jgi:hypothetical protein